MTKKHHFSVYVPKYSYHFELGKYYPVIVNGASYNPVICQFIKVTPKGFNLLVLETARCLLKHHLYVRKIYSGIPIPKHETHFTCKIPDWIQIKPKWQKVT